MESLICWLWYWNGFKTEQGEFQEKNGAGKSVNELKESEGMWKAVGYGYCYMIACISATLFFLVVSLLQDGGGNE
jgi:hypothetical protein